MECDGELVKAALRAMEVRKEFDEALFALLETVRLLRDHRILNDGSPLNFDFGYSSRTGDMIIPFPLGGTTGE